jgi:DnaD/phage-associated family protein
MAERRMFAKTIIDSDAFLDMPTSTQALYFHLGMRADDDGFINSPRKIMKIVGACEDDFKLLIAKRFVLSFESGVIVIKHWRIHNLIQKDRYKATMYTDELARLKLNGNRSYTDCIQNVNTLLPQVSLGEVSLGEVSLGEVSLGEDNTPPPDADFKKVIEAYNNNFPRLITQTISEEIQYWLEDMPADVVIHAIKQADIHNKRNWAYTQAILRSWLDNGVKTLDHAIEISNKKPTSQSQAEQLLALAQKAREAHDDNS